MAHDTFRAGDLTAIIEAVTGLELMAVPSVVVRLLLGGEISGASIPVGRVAGFGLLLAGDCMLAATRRHRLARPFPFPFTAAPAVHVETLLRSRRIHPWLTRSES